MEKEYEELLEKWEFQRTLIMAFVQYVGEDKASEIVKDVQAKLRHKQNGLDTASGRG